MTRIDNENARRDVGKWLNEGLIGKAPKREIAKLCAAFDKQETALRVLHTWAGYPKALVPLHVREMTAKALGIEPAQQRAGE